MTGDEQIELSDPLEHSIGGKGGHLLRRAFHISMSLRPWLYYWGGQNMTNWINELGGFNLSREMATSAIVFALIIAETIRLKMGVTVYGQRDYEANQISALAWGAFAVGMVCLTVPEIGLHGAALGAPLILSLSLGDPALGEMRRNGMDETKVMLYGTLFLATIWCAGAMWLDTPWWLIPLFAPLGVLAEKPRLRWIDDNATMLLIPLGLAILIGPWL
jgi:hypothetical protein